MTRKNMMMNTKKTILFLISMIIAGCAVGPDFKKPEVGTPENYQYSQTLQIDSLYADSLINLQWWKLFKDPLLDTLVQIALRENKNILISASRMEQARATLGFVKADALPRMDIEAGASRGNMAGRMQIETTANQFYIAPVLNWEIDFWGKFRRANESARAELIASRFSLATVHIGLIADVVSTYFLLLDYHQRLDISKQTLESRIESLDIIQKRYNEGIIPELDLNQSQIQLEIALAAIPVYERAIVQTENALNVLLGRLPSDIDEGPKLRQHTIPPDIPVGLPSSLLLRRPDIAQAEYLLKAQNARIGVATAMLYPAINLTGLLGVASSDLSSMSTGDPAWSLSAGLFGPLFNFNKNTLRVEIEEEKTKQALYTYENTILLAFREVEDALIEVETYKEQLASVDRKYKAAKNADRLSKERYDKGVTSYLEVLETQRTLFKVGLEHSELEQAYLSSYVRLYKALGGGWISEEEMIQAENSPVED
ncbi:MAG: efflux transporter outer membrane subunit [Calditrichia bacterium]|nr:efflux transporter outer membrane subunit [Calditrichia bacterium]